MKVYVIYADTYDGSWGCEISLFGVYDSYENAEKAVKELNNKNKYWYEIEELVVNECEEIYLGGYRE